MKAKNLSYKFSLTFNFTILAIATAITALGSVNSAQAETPRGFSCDTSSAIPTTMYHDSQGSKEPWIKWVSKHFANASWTPLSRCKTVSERLEKYRLSGKLKYVTLGKENDQQIICVASYDNGPCEGIIYTLRPEQDGIASLNNLFAWGSGQENLESNYESSVEIPYINVAEKLQQSENN